ncbi:MAG TPA: hypothetical protein VNH64_01485, partial [Parvularculaceae bacterium]|nr:hypothetical protein [Parvularculaceae bacterium]
AACAARTGARVALIGRALAPSPRGSSTPSIPDFVWRRLDLHESGLRLRPVGAYVSLFDDGRSLATLSTRRKTQDELERAGVGDYRLWQDFWRPLDALLEEGEAMARRAAVNGARAEASPLLGALAAPKGERTVAQLAASSRALLDDYFANENLKVHLASAGLALLGLGGDEAGSALAIASMGAPAGWRSRVASRGPSVDLALEEAAKAAGVDIIRQAPVDISIDEKLLKVTLDNDETLRTRRAMAASEGAAAREGLKVSRALAPLARREGAVADIRLKFSKAPPPPTADKDAIFFLADSLASFSEARDAVLDGRLPERPPLSFEYARDEIIVHAPYCPATLRTEGETRDWTEQDRQAFGRQIIARLAPYLNGAAQNIRRIDVEVSVAGARRSAANECGIAAPPSGHDAIGAAARLALDFVNGG